MRGADVALRVGAAAISRPQFAFDSKDFNTFDPFHAKLLKLA
jgi:hypothetical protein